MVGGLDADVVLDPVDRVDEPLAVGDEVRALVVEVRVAPHRLVACHEHDVEHAADEPDGGDQSNPARK